MATYIMLCSFTDQGIRNVKDTTKRAAVVSDAAKRFGADMKEIYWTMGQYDIVVMVEASDDASMSAFALAVGAAGNVRGQTMRAYSKEEMDKILANVT
jgi:uncharacterized protein with GYD domain